MRPRFTLGLVVFIVTGLIATTSPGQHKIGDLCHVKGQEVNTLRGVGLVVGLDGSGDPNLLTTQQAVARALVNSGIELPVDSFGREDLSEFQSVANAALVFVTARVAAEGGRQGSLIDCKVHTFGNANSLSGGTLLPTPMTGGPATGSSGDLLVYAVASGKIETNALDVLTAGSIREGCQLNVDFENRFYYFEEPSERYETAPQPYGPSNQPRMFVDLVIDRNHASFQTAADISDEINQSRQLLGLEQDRNLAEPRPFAIAKDPVTIQVEVPEFHQADPVSFVSNLLNINIISDEKSIVVIDERTGTIIVGREVSFSPCAVTSGDFAIELGPFRPLDLDGIGPVQGGPEQKLTDLVEMLNSLQAPPETIIDIIKQLKTARCLYGRLIIEN